MVFYVPRTYKCDKCGHEGEYSKSLSWPAPVVNDTITCPVCWESWLNSNWDIGKMQVKKVERD